MNAETPLSPRESEILRLVANGATDKQVAKALSLAPGTVRTYLQRSYAKLDANGRTQAAMKYMDWMEGK